MVITFSCKVCDFQTTSPVFACHHLLLAHPDIVEPLHEYLEKEIIPGSEESLLSFVLETSKSKENGSIASEEASDINKTIAAIKDLETFVVPIHYDPSQDDEQLFLDNKDSDQVCDVIASIDQEDEKNNDTCLPIDEGSAPPPVCGPITGTPERKLTEEEKLGKNPENRTAELKGLKEKADSEKSPQAPTGEQEEAIPVKKEPFSEFSLIEMEELIGYIRRWMHVDKHCNKCHSKIKGQRLTNLHHCAANTGVTLCEICGKYYRNNGYGNHVRQVHNKGKLKARCKHCNKEMTASALFKHFRYVHERELHKVACGMCGKMMSTKEHLRRHEIIHRMEMPFKCPFCQRGFSQKSNMHHHIRQHTGEQPYNCDHCQRAFTHKVSLKNHLKKQHGIDLWKEGQTGGGRPKPKDEEEEEEEESMDDGN